MINDALFEISTAGDPAITFEAGGELYELRTISHLNKLEEIHVRGLSRRETQYVRQLNDETLPDAQVKSINEKLVGLRVELICLMTTMPREVVEALPTIQQKRLVTYISMEKADLVELLTPKPPEDGDGASAA